ncbi:flagellar biosynthetic protein FliR [Stieleria marina]|uniref:Flagellar biosynthesis protein FliR n=1 Tax=Stieleria marina TaxID=1930275 RepID=A0A517NPC5_9BACT|nr:flagellar biosynthesis protein FliR [Planctomycetes bacterium K23_9]
MIESLSNWSHQFFVDHLILALLVMTRIGALLVAIPSMTAVIERKMQVLLAATITFLILPTVAANTATEIPDSSHIAEVLIAVVHEALIGLLIGTTVQLIITGIQVGAEVTSTSGAIQAASTTDESGQSMPALARLVGLLIVAILFAAGGHRLIMNILLDSFTRLPPGTVVLNESMLTLVIDQLTSGMVAGLRIAAPVIAALLLSNLVIGLISRTLPQLNVLAIGLSINALAILVVTAITIGSAGLIFQEELAVAVQKLSEIW